MQTGEVAEGVLREATNLTLFGARDADAVFVRKEEGSARGVAHIAAICSLIVRIEVRVGWTKAA